MVVVVRAYTRNVRSCVLSACVRERVFMMISCIACAPGAQIMRRARAAPSKEHTWFVGSWYILLRYIHIFRTDVCMQFTIPVMRI